MAQSLNEHADKPGEVHGRAASPSDGLVRDDSAGLAVTAASRSVGDRCESTPTRCGTASTWVDDWAGQGASTPRRRRARTKRLDVGAHQQSRPYDCLPEEGLGRACSPPTPEVAMAEGQATRQAMPPRRRRVRCRPGQAPRPPPVHRAWSAACRPGGRGAGCVQGASRESGRPCDRVRCSDPR